MYLLAAPAHRPSSPAPTVNIVHILSVQLSSGTLGARARGDHLISWSSAALLPGASRKCPMLTPNTLSTRRQRWSKYKIHNMLCYNFYYMCHY